MNEYLCISFFLNTQNVAIESPDRNRMFVFCHLAKETGNIEKGKWYEKGKKEGQNIQNHYSGKHCSLDIIILESFQHGIIIISISINWLSAFW